MTRVLDPADLIADGHDCLTTGCWWEEGFHRTPGGTCAECGTCGDPECCPGGCDCRWPPGIMVANGRAFGRLDLLADAVRP